MIVKKSLWILTATGLVSCMFLLLLLLLARHDTCEQMRLQGDDPMPVFKSVRLSATHGVIVVHSTDRPAELQTYFWHLAPFRRVVAEK
jgi:hypothetical protein